MITQLFSYSVVKISVSKERSTSAPHLGSTLPVSCARGPTSASDTGGFLSSLQGEIRGYRACQFLTNENTGKLIINHYIQYIIIFILQRLHPNNLQVFSHLLKQSAALWLMWKLSINLWCGLRPCEKVLWGPDGIRTARKQLTNHASPLNNDMTHRLLQTDASQLSQSCA